MKLNVALLLILTSVGFAAAHADERDYGGRARGHYDRGQYDRGEYDRGRDDLAYGPFTPDEAQALRAVWHRIREAENFSDINWRSVGLRRAPGDRDARAFMAADWQSLRRAEDFDDINWNAEYRRR